MTPDMNAKVGRLEKGVVVLASDVEALTDQVVIERNWRRRFTIAALGVGGVFLALVVVLIVLAIGNHSLLSKFNECTNPGSKAHPHACYDKGQATTAAAVSSLTEAQTKASAYAVECVIAGRADVLECVEQRQAGAPRPAAATSGTDATTTTTTAVPRRSSTPATVPRRLPSTALRPPTTVTRSSTTVASMSTTVPTVMPCSLDLRVFCVTKPTGVCAHVAGTCVPVVSTS